MKYIYVLEDDPRLQKQIYEALRKSDPQAQIRYFLSFEDFKNWIPVAIKNGKSALFEGGVQMEGDTVVAASAQADDELLLLISKDEWLGSRYMSLVEKTQQLFIRKGLCTKENATRLVLTVFESPNFDVKLVENRIISNVIFKPFDELILQQHLNFAYSGHQPASQTFVHNVQTKQQVEMTKEVQMEAVGDVGFVTRSPRAIEVGKVSKYYGEVFKGKGRIHVMGRCIACEPIADEMGGFRVWFSYFGIPSSQISDIRKSMVKRNEIEFSANSPIKLQTESQKWIVLDANNDRFQKIKKILQDTFNAEVSHVTSFDDFVFQNDPMAYDSARKEKPWGELPGIKITLDAKKEKPFKLEPDEAVNKRLMGWTWEDWKSKDFASRLHPVSVPTWKSIVQGKKTVPQILMFQNEGIFFPLLLKNISTVNNQWVMDFIEPATAEKSNWFKENFPNPASASAIVIGEEYLTEARAEFWQDFREGKKTKFYSMHAKIPEETESRNLSWIDDLFEESNDAFYLQRKLSWVYGLPTVTGSSSPFLNSAKEVIRVANPVEIAEFSEAGLVMNYYREIDQGAFRQFVLAKTGETFFEYRAVCNFTSEHPTEKGMFQNHFVFFGITDAYLKSIRVWILENYIHTKQQEGA